jgi:hypothetical protein
MDPAILQGAWKMDVNSDKYKLSGTLQIRQESGKRVVAEYYLNNSSTPLQIEDIYVWGSSIYFRLPFGGDDYVVFKGMLRSGGQGRAILVSKVLQKEQPEFVVSFRK